LSCSVSLVVFRSYRNCFIEESRFCYRFLPTCLTLNIFGEHPLWKHNSLHGLFFYNTGKWTITCRATKYYFTYILFTQNYHHQEHGNFSSSNAYCKNYFKSCFNNHRLKWLFWGTCHTRFCKQSQVLIACVPMIIYSTHTDIKCSQIAKYHE
jgi:hypothetical protein